MHPFLYRPSGFMGSQNDYETADFVLFGAPMDFTASFQSGSRFGPQGIRHVSEGLEEYSFYQQHSLTEVAFFDAGDVELPLGNVGASLARIEAVAQKFYTDDKTPLMMGGEHLVTLPQVKAALAKFPNLAVFHLDAHADLRQNYLGEELSHATVMRHVAHLIGPRHLYQFGIRSGTAAEYAFGTAHTNFFVDDIVASLRRVIAGWTGQPVYVTIDIDVVDPAFAPGTGTPEPGGCTAKEIIEAVLLLNKLPVIGVDLVEYLPHQDSTHRTALLAAKIIREFLIGLAFK